MSLVCHAQLEVVRSQLGLNRQTHGREVGLAGGGRSATGLDGATQAAPKIRLPGGRRLHGALGLETLPCRGNRGGRTITQEGRLSLLGACHSHCCGQNRPQTCLALSRKRARLAELRLRHAQGLIARLDTALEPIESRIVKQSPPRAALEDVRGLGGFPFARLLE